MKKTLLFLFTFFLVVNLFGQGADCGSGAPFCTGTTYNFPATTGVTSPTYGTYPNYGCLCTMPNPAWYYLQIGNPGNLVIHISTSPAEDVDFICWGPFSSPTSACADSLTGNCTDCITSCPNNIDNPTFYPSGNITDCSYSANATEDCYINNALTGQYYMLLITNYSDLPCNIIFSQTNAGTTGAGTTNCGILPTPVGNNGPLCQGDTLKLNAMTVAGANYSWTGPNGFTSYLQNPIIPNVTAADSGYYSCLVMIGAQLSPEDSTFVIIHSRPSVTATSDTICEGNSATLTASGASTYLWTSSGSTANPYSVSPNSTSTYTVIGINTFNCSDTATAVVTVNPGPTITVNSPGICIGDTATLTASGASTYLWSNAATNNPTMVTPIVTTTYTVTGTDINNCVGTASAIVTVGTPPVVQLTNDTTICFGTSVTLSASGGANYMWGGQGGDQTTPSISVTPSAITTYPIEVTDASGCKKDTTITVKLSPLPVPVLTLSTDTICKGATTVISASGGATYYWTPGGETTASITVQPLSDATYTVTVSNNINGIICSASSIIIQLVRNCNTIFIPNAFSPYGHNSVFRPLGNITNTADYSLQIWDRWGQLLFETTNTEIGWDGRIKGEVAPVGVYIYHIKLNDNINPVFEKIGTVTLLQ